MRRLDDTPTLLVVGTLSGALAGAASAALIPPHSFGNVFLRSVAGGIVGFALAVLALRHPATRRRSRTPA